MHNPVYDDLLLRNPVHNSVITINKLSKVGVTFFWNYPTHIWLFRKQVYSTPNFIQPLISMEFRIHCYILVNSMNVFRSPR